MKNLLCFQGRVQRMRLSGDRRTILPTFGKGLSKVKVMRVKSLVQEYDLFLIFVLKIWEFFFCRMAECIAVK